MTNTCTVFLVRRPVCVELQYFFSPQSDLHRFYVFFNYYSAHAFDCYIVATIRAFCYEITHELCITIK